jgi:hypothetical protein
MINSKTNCIIQPIICNTIFKHKYSKNIIKSPTINQIIIVNFKCYYLFSLYKDTK